MQWLYGALVFLAGCGVTLQTGANATLRGALGHPMHPGVANFLVGMITVLLISLAVGTPMPGVVGMRAAPAYAWVGGMCGAFFVFAGVTAAPRLGAVLFMVMLFSGQVVAGMIADHFGLLGFAQIPISAGRLVGVALVLAGALVVRLS